MITARRTCATERRDVGYPKRRAASIVLAVAAVSLGSLTGCASKPTDSSLVGRPLPGNEDTAAAQAQLRVGGAKASAPKQAAAATPTTILIPSGTYSSAQAAENAMQTDLMSNMNGNPRLEISPPQVNGSTRAPLEIIDMPMWLWVDAPAESTVISSTSTTGDANDTVVESVVIDSAVWSVDAVQWLNCAATSAAPNGAGVPYNTADDPNNVINVVPQACITTPTAPYYAATTINGIPTEVDGVHQLTAQVTWHLAYTITTPAGVTTGPFPIANSGSNGAPQAGTPLTFRVGEIQALAVS